MTNPGVAGTAEAVREAGGSIGWNVRVIDGQGTPAGVREALGQAVALPARRGSSSAGSTRTPPPEQVEQASDMRIPLVGWHAASRPRTRREPSLACHITTRVEDVARISAVLDHRQVEGHAGVVIFTDSVDPLRWRTRHS